MNGMEYHIDAAEKIVGRLAGEVANLLQGKNDPRFDPARHSGNRVTVCNTDRMRTTGRKSEQKLYRHHSGYPGGLKEESLERMQKRDSRLVLKHAVNGMLPKNRLRALMMKNLTLLKKEP